MSLAALRYTWTHYRGTARVRAFYWRHVRGVETEICHQCGRPVGVVWWCSDDLLWQEVTGHAKRPGSKEAAAGTWCISCFDAAAKDLCPWIEWGPMNQRHLLKPEIQARAAKERHQRHLLKPEIQARAAKERHRSV